MQMPEDKKLKADYPTQVHAAYPPQPEFAPYGSSNSMPIQPNPNTSSDTDPMFKGFEFSDASIRRGFIRKVYGILSVQLTLTLGAVMLFVHHDGFREFARDNFYIAILAIVLVLITIISISCCEGVRKTSPTNIIFLSLFTIGESYMVGFATLSYDKDTVRFDFK